MKRLSSPTARATMGLAASATILGLALHTFLYWFFWMKEGAVGSFFTYRGTGFNTLLQFMGVGVITALILFIIMMLYHGPIALIFNLKDKPSWWRHAISPSLPALIFTCFLMAAWIYLLIGLCVSLVSASVYLLIRRPDLDTNADNKAMLKKHSP